MNKIVINHGNQYISTTKQLVGNCLIQMCAAYPNSWVSVLQLLFEISWFRSFTENKMTTIDKEAEITMSKCGELCLQLPSNQEQI